VPNLPSTKKNKLLSVATYQIIKYTEEIKTIKKVNNGPVKE
jgi:hypothetical protein